MDRKQIFSIGIDIGTSTFQMIISQLTIENALPAYVIPKFQITNKEIIYRSHIYFTPMLNNELLDMAEIKQLLKRELSKSGIPHGCIETGAIIVTGEAANKTNADTAAQELAEFAGDFVVAIAGPDLEASLAGYGSGASELSEKHHLTLANLDIGGGTTNVAVFKNGNLQDQYALHIGGKLIRFDENNNIIYISPKILPFFKEKGLSFKIGEKISFWQMKTICYELANVIVNILKRRTLTPGEKTLQIYHENKSIPIEGCTISGGVGELLYSGKSPSTIDEAVPFQDIGLCLASELRQLLIKNEIPIYNCPEKIQATVIGAGVHSMQLSGSTICYDKELLPLKNIPVVVMKTDLFTDIPGAIKQEMEKYLKIYQGKIVFYFTEKKSPSYKELKKAATELWKFYTIYDLPILLVFKSDIAKAMGQTLKIISRHSRPLICIDTAEPHKGDYIDFNKAIGETMLITIKTLLYKN